MAKGDFTINPGLFVWYDDPERAGFQRCQTSYPGYVDPDVSGKGFGKHGLELAWYIRGPQGAVGYEFHTGWVPGQIGLEYRSSQRAAGASSITELFPSSGRVSLHSLAYLEDSYNGVSPTRKNCELAAAEPGPCWSTSYSYSHGEEMLIKYIEFGDRAIWEELFRIYDEDMKPNEINRETWASQDAAWNSIKPAGVE